MPKTKEQLGDELSRAITEAKVQYDSIVKPAQEKFKAIEIKARLIFEQIDNSIRDKYPKDVFSDPDSYLFYRDGEIYTEDLSWPETTTEHHRIPFEKWQDETHQRKKREEYQKQEVAKQLLLNWEQDQKVINAANDIANDAFKKTLSNAMLEYMAIEKPANAILRHQVELAYKQYDDAVKDLEKVDEWFRFRRTYQQGLRSKTMASTCNAPVSSMEIITNPQKLKCHFCGDSEARTKAGLNKVRYRLKHPGVGFWSRLFGRDWKYACHDCTNYMIHIWGSLKYEVVDSSVQTGKTYYCKNEQHQMCGGLECECDCHKHVMLYDTEPFVVAGSVCLTCQGSGRLPWVLPYLTRECTTCNGSGRVFK
jgi:hypothetical protein